MLKNTFPLAEAIPAHMRLEPVEQREYLCGGAIHLWEGPQQEVHSPVCVDEKGVLTPVRLGSYPLMDEERSLACLAAARKAWDKGRGQWPTCGAEARIRCVERFIKEMQAVKAPVVKMLMWEICKTAQDAEKEFDRTIDYIQDTIDALKDLERQSSRFVRDQSVLAQIRRAPLGITLCMGPFNYPLNETFTTLLPALIMGNPVIFKPAKYGALLFYPLLEAFQRCFPPGVVNTLYGEGKTVIPPIMASGDVDVFAFIGSSGAANAIERLHPRPNRLRTVYGLGAKNPGILLPDADLELSVKECLQGCLSYNGQRCTALKILFVHESILEAFLERFCQQVDALRAGMPWETGVQITPLPEDGKVAYFQGLMEDAVSKGAKVLNARGGQHCGTLFFPAVLSPVNRDMRIWHEEQFGPLVPVVPYREMEEAIRYIEESPFGQQASVFGRDADGIARAIDPLVNQVCRLNVNCQCQRGPDTYPFTGRKDSAEGTLSVTDALRVFSIRSLVAGKDGELNRQIFTEITRQRKSAFLSTDYLF